MMLGEIYRFMSDKAVGYTERDKIHIFLTKTSDFRAPEENVFLFISSSDYGGCHAIKKTDYDKVLDYDSFISCGNLVFYSDDYLESINAKKIGLTSTTLLKSLHSHLVDHDQMPGWQIKIACGALSTILHL